MSSYIIPESSTDQTHFSSENTHYPNTLYTLARLLASLYLQFRRKEPSKPFIIGLTGSVSCGKSTLSHHLHTLLSQYKTQNLRVSIIQGDAFLYSNAILEEQRLMHNKGFPETYNNQLIQNTLNSLRANQDINLPVYSHIYYDILPSKKNTIVQSDIILWEGLNILGSESFMKQHPFDLYLYLDVSRPILETWFTERFLKFCQKNECNAESIFHQFKSLSQAEKKEKASFYWKEINLKNFEDNILPYKHKADVIIKKNKSHNIEIISCQAKYSELYKCVTAEHK